MDEKDFPEIKTGNGIDRDLAATANDRIKKAAIEINSLAAAIEVLSKQASEQSKTLIKLTWWIVGLTVLMVLGLAIQIYISTH